MIALPGVMKPLPLAFGTTDSAFAIVTTGRARIVFVTVFVVPFPPPVDVQVALLDIVVVLPAAAGVFAVTLNVSVAAPKGPSVPMLKFPAPLQVLTVPPVTEQLAAT